MKRGRAETGAPVAGWLLNLITASGDGRAVGAVRDEHGREVAYFEHGGRAYRAVLTETGKAGTP